MDVLDAVVRVVGAMSEDFSAIDASQTKAALTRYLEQRNSAVSLRDVNVDLASEDDHHALLITAQKDGSQVTTKITKGFVKSVEYKDLLKQYSLAKEVGEGPFVLVAKQTESSFKTFDELAMFIESTARKGQSIQRYKGLGEMNPGQLWETTMDPKLRTLLRVTIEDAVEADEAFADLMGDEVEPRREFIERVALDSFELDI